MGLAGSLRTMSPGDLLQWLSISQKSGTLRVTNRGIEKRIFFEDGRVISSASNNPREYLGQFLMSYGYITEDELKKAMEVQEQSQILLGKILVMIDAIAEVDLIRLMRLKAEEEIYEIFLWPEADFEFFDDLLPTMAMVALQIDITGIIMEGSRRVDEWIRIRKLIPNLDVIPVIEKPVDQAALSEVQRMIIQVVNGHRTIDEIVLESRSSDFTVCKTIYDYLQSGAMRLLDLAATPQRIEPQTADVFLTPEAEVESLLARSETALKAKDFEKTLRLLKAAQNLDPESAKVKKALKHAESSIASALNKEGVVESKIPQLRKPLDEIGDMNFGPNEGFILSRINGSWNIGSIVKVSPMRETDALLIFYRLARDGVLELK
ncbi:MAG TPA: DUF4388 domain-containing protein [Thermoanaerobaculia bacterium]